MDWTYLRFWIGTNLPMNHHFQSLVFRQELHVKKLTSIALRTFWSIIIPTCIRSHHTEFEIDRTKCLN